MDEKLQAIFDKANEITQAIAELTNEDSQIETFDESELEAIDNSANKAEGKSGK